MEFILIVTKPQAVIWPLTAEPLTTSVSKFKGYKTASGNLAFHR